MTRNFPLFFFAITFPLICVATVAVGPIAMLGSLIVIVWSWLRRRNRAIAAQRDLARRRDVWGF